jgi:hypothetical protein
MAKSKTKTKLQHPRIVFWLLVLVGIMLLLIVLPYITK